MGTLILVIITLLILHSFEAFKYRFGSPEWREAIKRDKRKSLLLILIWLPFAIWGIIKFVALTIACFHLGGMYIAVYFIGISILALLWYFLWRLFIKPI